MAKTHLVFALRSSKSFLERRFDIKQPIAYIFKMELSTVQRDGNRIMNIFQRALLQSPDTHFIPLCTLFKHRG